MVKIKTKIKRKIRNQKKKAVSLKPSSKSINYMCLLMIAMIFGAGLMFAGGEYFGFFDTDGGGDDNTSTTTTPQQTQTTPQTTQYYRCKVKYTFTDVFGFIVNSIENITFRVASSTHVACVTVNVVDTEDIWFILTGDSFAYGEVVEFDLFSDLSRFYFATPVPGVVPDPAFTLRFEDSFRIPDYGGHCDFIWEMI